MKRDFWKHPRLRGEDPPIAAPKVPLMETPPLTRGRLEGEHARGDLGGNTPAYAGKTTISFVVILMRRKHPRLRGEDLYARHDLEAEFRNTPAYAGKTRSRHQLRRCHGNTPAYAGKTTATWCPSDTTRETPPLTRGRPTWLLLASLVMLKHPRLRGEDVVCEFWTTGLIETPPLTRGRRRRCRCAFARARNTPAYAGKTASRPSRSRT